jgi:AraC family transcriptional regulator of adaptative response/methylated-DNA-[protein]-cysteine methyltransferase
MHIDFGVFDTVLGPVLMAATPRGLCALHPRSPSAPLPISVPLPIGEALPSDFSAWERRENPQALREYADGLAAFLERRTNHFTPTLDILTGTAFQRRVWAELQRIPAGQTLSYTTLAERLGQPRAVRAVAGACARNAIAIAIPCHRIVRADGALAGFRWGLECKRRLLAWEAEPPAG